MDNVKKIILDCDPGYDDAVAILLACGHTSIDLLGITTVAGNQTLDKVTHNALAVLEKAKIDGVCVAAGCDRPLIRKIQTTLIHGSSGLDGPKLPKIQKAISSLHAIDFIIDTIMSQPKGEVTLVPTGALTNIAMAVRKEPRIVERVKEVVLMGGGVYTGNSTAVAEFNITFDPEAAYIVFQEHWPITMVGLDVTHQALATPNVIQNIANLKTEISDFVVEILQFFGENYKNAHGFQYPPIHDPCAVAYVIDPRVMEVRKAPIQIELDGKWTSGMTVVDMRYPADPACLTQVGLKLDQVYFWNLIIDALKNIEGAKHRTTSK